MSYHTTALTSPPVTAWTPSSFHLLASQRAGCSTTFVTKIQFLTEFRDPSRSDRILFLKNLCSTSFWMYLVFTFVLGDREFCVFIYRYFESVFRLRRTVAAQRLQRYILLPRSPGANSDEPPHGFTLRREPSSLSRIACRPPNLVLGKFR